MNEIIDKAVAYFSPVARFFTREQFVGIVTGIAKMAAENIWDKANPEAPAPENK